MISEFQNGRWQIRLADGTVIADANLHCVSPCVQGAGFVGFGKTGGATRFSVYKLATKTHFDLALSASGGECFGAFDGRYMVLAQRNAQGKNDQMLDLVAVIFDTVAERFLDFSALPTLQVFRVVGSGAQTKGLWVKNGRQVTGFEGNDPVGIVRGISFPAPNRIQFVLAQGNSSGITTKLILCEREIDLATGAMGAIKTTEYPYDASKPLPEWY